MASKLKIIPLGGLGEIGKNLTVYEYGKDMFLVDCGMGFPDQDLYGVDMVIPDISYLKANKNRIRGMVITHGHEDHIGAIPYVLKQLDMPIYATPLTAAIIELKLEEHDLLYHTQIFTKKPGDKFKLGCFEVEFIHTNHSIADSVALAIKTPIGTVIHTGDFKIDLTPIQGGMIDLPRLGQLGNEGVLALLSDSTNVERPGYCASEARVIDCFDELFKDCNKRIIVTTFASNVHRLQQIINGLDDYKVPIYDMFRFLEQEMHDGNITLSGDVQDTLDDLFDQLDEAQKQLQSDDYSRMVVYLNLPEETDETFAFVNKMHDIIGKYYATDSFYVVGNTTSAMDLSSSFGEDNLLISVLSALFVILVLLFTFKSAGLPVLLIIVIQGSIWINFSVPYLQHTPLYFLGYLIVNSIQMGANIDYAIVISSHYTDLKKVMRPKEAIVAALNESFPTIFTSGSILASAGILISVLTTNPVISAIGTCLGRGTIVSIVLVLFVLPQILILGDTIIERTSFEMKGVAGMARTASGTMHVNGRVRGYINGVVDAEIKGVLHGQFSANIATGTEFTVDKPDMYLSEKNIHESEDGAPEPGTPDTPDTDTKGGDAE